LDGAKAADRLLDPPRTGQVALDEDPLGFDPDHQRAQEGDGWITGFHEGLLDALPQSVVGQRRGEGAPLVPPQIGDQGAAPAALDPAVAERRRSARPRRTTSHWAT